jgi:hypothetical protein
VKRELSHTEISAAMDCQAKHAFAYTGHLTGGTTLRPRAAHARLREGRAWGAAVAELHAAVDGGSAVTPVADPIADSSPATLWPSDAAPGPEVVTLRPAIGSPACDRTPTADSSLHRYARALRAMHAALDEDADQLREHGFYDPREHEDMAARLADMLWHYASTSEPLDTFNAETELRVPIPSRTGRQASSRFVFVGYLDNLSRRRDLLYIVEYKLRGRLSTYEQAARGRQYRRYAWAAERALDEPIAGVILDERLNEVPKPARWVKAKRKGEDGSDLMTVSHAKDQMTTVESYLEACDEAQVFPSAVTIEHLEQRRWQVRHTLTFRRSEIEEAGRELVSAAHLISQLDAGVLWPVRNESTLRCGGCAFREVCPRPGDTDLIDLNFERRVPKRDKELEVAA